METQYNSPRVEIAFSKPKILLLMLYNLAITGVGAYLIFESSRFPLILELFLKISALIGIIFFGSSLILFGLKLLDKRPGFIIDREGFIDYADALSAGRVNWENVKGINELHFLGQTIIVVNVQNEKSILQNQPFYKKWLMYFNRKRFGTPVTIASGALEMDSDKLFQLIKQNWRG